MTLLAPSPPKPQPPQTAPPNRRQVTPEEMLSMPNAKTMELVDGQLAEKSVSKEAAKTEGVAYVRLWLHAQQADAAEVYPGTLGFQCFPDAPRKVRKPDVSVIRMARIVALTEFDPGHMPIVPDLAVEVISPKDVHYKVIEKVQEYLDAGFPLVWVLDPAGRTLTIYPNGGPQLFLSGDDEATCEDVLPGFRCRVEDFFTGVKPRPLPAE